MLSNQTIEGSCYLLFSEANGGSFWLHWSRTPVGGALASFAPAVDVAAHKYSTNHGKAELCCDVGGPDVKKFYAGWASFIKMARAHGAALSFVENVTRQPVRAPRARAACARRVRHGHVHAAHARALRAALVPS